MNAVSDESKPSVFNAECRECARLVSFLNAEKRVFPDYHNAPVAPFGDPDARLLVVGLAPGFHGANQTGRPFTGDHAGIILYKTLHQYGFASAPESTSRDDGLHLTNCRISNAVKCVPPQNKPLPGEIRTCNRYLSNELALLPPNAVLIALGVIAHEATLLGMGLPIPKYKFAHGAEFKLPNGMTLLDSYHCSRYNTQTRRLTEDMFSAVFRRAKELLDG
ncbi:MAG TPA: uracil-DNA glycosylase [Steroidobacteraceae bacterium]|nr:uracil-DNA glycosylase [Steroidobacteraceae bacterium]